MTIEILLSLVELIRCTKSKEMCKSRVESLLGSQFELHVLSSQLPIVLEGIFEALNNAILSTSDTFEALNQFGIRMADRMKELAHLWAAPIYGRLLSPDRVERELAVNCLQKLKLILLPPTALLAKTVAESMQNDLLTCMERMIESESYKVPVVNAWAWFISLLGGHVLENRVLVNRMLKILERTFLDADMDVRIASQAAWKSMVDILVPSALENGMEQCLRENKPGLIMRDLVERNQEPLVQLTSKRMKLLMTPLVGTMTVEKSEKARNSCWKICVYILQKLGCFVNRMSVMQFILVPMFESVFKSGRSSWNMWVWDSCAGLFEEFLSLKIKDTSQRQALPIECLPIKWPQWRLCHMEFLLKIFESLWKSYAGDVAGSGEKKLCLNVVLRIWKLVLKGLDMEGTDTAESSSEHQAAVHLILRFVSTTCEEVALLFESTHDRVLVLSVWPLLEYLVLEFRPLVLSSSLYNLSLNQGKGNGAPVSTAGGCTATKLVCNGPSYTDDSECEKMVTPVSYISMVWLKFLTSLKLYDIDKADMLCENIDDHWLLNVWRAFIEHHLGEQAKSNSGIPCYNQSESTDLFALPLLLFPCLVSSISKVKKISDKTEVPILFNACPTSEEVQVFAGDFSKVCNITVCSSLLMNSDHSQPSVKTYSVQEYHVDGINLYGSECSALMDIHHEFATIYGRFVTCLVKETCGILNGDARLGSSGIHGIDAASTAAQPSKLTNTLSLAARFLMLTYEAQRSNVENSSTIARVCEALVSLSSSLHTQYDTLLFIQILAKPLANWLCVCWDPENHSARKSMALDQDKIASSKQTESFPSVCKIIMRPLDPDNGTNIIGFNSCGDVSILSLVSRFLIIAWDVQNDISKINVDSFSRVCESLICFSTYLKAQHDTLACMQVISKPLIKWFSGSVYSEVTCDISHQMLLLEKIWCQILTSLQNCHPPLSFDSCLLNQQAPLLASAFQSPYKAIAEQTLLFWERTYGVKTSRLSYPSCLVPVLCELQHKVKITLPGFLHTYVSRRGLKHQTKKRVQEFCATQKAALFMDPSGHSGQANVNMVPMVGQTKNCNGEIEVDPASDCKTCAIDDNMGRFRKKSGRLRKCKCNATPPVLNHKCRKTMRVQHNSDLVAKTEIEHVFTGEHVDQGNIDSNTKLSIPVENIQGPKRKGRRTRKHKSHKYKPFVIANRNLAKQGKHSGDCDEQCEIIRDHDAVDHILDSNEGVTMESVNEAEGNLMRSGRRRKSPQLKQLTSDLKTLGIRHLRTLRNAGGLRGGKDWRTTHEMKKMLPKRARRQSQEFSISGKTDPNIAIESDTNMQVSGNNSLYMGVLGRALKKQKLERQLCRCKRLSSVRRSQVDASEKACEASRQSVSESPFKVRALGGGVWLEGISFSKPLRESEETVPFTCNVNISPSMEKKPEGRSRNNRRKSCTPKRAPSNLVGEEITNMHLESTSFSQFTISADEQAISTGKRLKDVGTQLFTQQGWGNAKLATPLKRLKTVKDKCTLIKEDANMKLENSVDPCHAEHVCDGNVTSWAGVQLQSPALCDRVQSGKQSNLEQGDWQQEGTLIFGMGDDYSPKDNSKDLDARNEVSSKAPSDATDQEMETDGLDLRPDQLHESSSQLNNHDAQSTEEEQLLQRRTQLCDLNGSSGTSTEICTEPSIVNHTVATCKYACMAKCKIHHYSKNGLTFLEEMGKEWNICDLLCELSSSPKLEELGREDLISAEKLVLVLSQRIAKRKKLLSKLRV